MKKSLGILVNTNIDLQNVLGLVKAAYKKNISTQVFFTGPGVVLTQRAEFEELVGLARLCVCDVSFRAVDLSGDVPGVGFKDFATQAVNAEMAANCDRYIVL